MQLYLNIFGLQIPSYGFFIALGGLIANLVALLTLKKWRLLWEDLVIIEGYVALGMMIGAKLLYIIVSFNQFDLRQIGNLQYLGAIMSSGFVFYGGLIGVFFALWLVHQIHKIDVLNYLKHFVFMIPLCHAFGRIGCFMAGCCYGVPYSGFLSVRFPHGSFAPAGLDLFPVQAVEASALLLLAAVLFTLDFFFSKKYTVYLYLIVYSILRFILEFFRYDAIRGHWGSLSTSQWLSIMICAAALLLMIVSKKNYD